MHGVADEGSRLPERTVNPELFACRKGSCRTGWGKRLFATGRRSKDEPFGPPVMLADAALTGPITGGVWVAPQEDVIFYCSPGPDKKPGSGRELRTIRF